MEDNEVAYLKFEKLGSCSILHPHQLFSKKPPNYSIKYNFSFKTITHEWFSSRESVDFVAEQVTLPLVHKSVHAEFEQDSNCQTRRRTIRQELTDPNLNLPEEMREWIVKEIVRETNRMIKEAISLKHNVFNVNAQVTMKTNYTVFESDEWMERIMQVLGMREDVLFMIPATDKSIKSLKKKLIASDGQNGSSESCLICLEEFFPGCHVSCMPCSHSFHIDCIKKWLKTSHYCPICRFEMPTE